MRGSGAGAFARERAVVIGLGASGAAAARVLAAEGASVRVTEARDEAALVGLPELEHEGVEVLAGGHRPEHLDGASLVVTSPGVPEHAPVLVWAADRGLPVWSEIELGARLARVPYVAVTGTNGKSTTTEMVAAAMRAAGLRAAACGNIGHPFSLAALEDHEALAVEVSSFQLHHHVSFHPRVSVLLNLAPDHLDWHGSFAAYAEAKARVFELQEGRDVHVGNADDAGAAEVSRGAPCEVRWFRLGAPAAGEVGYEDGELVARRATAVSLGRPRGTGAGFRADAAAAAAATFAFGLDAAAVRDGIGAVAPLPHRGQEVAAVGGVRFVDDSKATNPHAALAALEGMRDVVLIAGGLAKGVDLWPLAAAIPVLRGVVAIGEAAPEVAAVFEGRVPVRRAPSVEVAAREAFVMAGGRGTVLLAPACASQDMFRDYAERGDRFAAAAREIAAGGSGTPRPRTDDPIDRDPNGPSQTRTTGKEPPVAGHRKHATASGSKRGSGPGSTTSLRVVRSDERPTRRDRMRASRRARRAERAARGPMPRTVVVMLAAAFLLTGIGLVMVLSASSVSSFQRYGTSFLFLKRQAIYAVIGTLALLLTLRIPYRRWERWSVPLLIVSVALLALALHPSIGTEAGGSSRWIEFGPVTIQPSELAKLAMVAFAAMILTRKWRRLDEPGHLAIPLLPVTLVVCGIIILQRDLGTTTIVAASVFVLVFAAGVRLRYLIFTGLVGAVVGWMLIMGEGYRKERLLSFLNPWADPQVSGYQLVQSLIGLGSGGMFGVGLGASRQKWMYIPNAHTDFIFSILGEELGLLGEVVVLALFIVLVYCGVRIASRVTDTFGRLLAIGIVAWLGLQTLVNLGAVTGVLPVTGVPLPFVSFGGSSLIVTLAAVGILANIGRTAAVGQTVEESESPAGRKRGRARKARRARKAELRREAGHRRDVAAAIRAEASRAAPETRRPGSAKRGAGSSFRRAKAGTTESRTAAPPAGSGRRRTSGTPRSSAMAERIETEALAATRRRHPAGGAHGGRAPVHRAEPPARPAAAKRPPARTPKPHKPGPPGRRAAGRADPREGG